MPFNCCTQDEKEDLTLTVLQCKEGETELFKLGVKPDKQGKKDA